MNATLTAFVPRTERGRDLLDSWIRPICARLGIRLVVVPPGAEVGAALAARRTSTFVVWDCSVEGPEDVYAALDARAKLAPGSIVLSRSPLPRNVLTRVSHAPVHGETLENPALGEWLERYLRRALGTGRAPSPSPPGHYWMFDKPADYFLSFHSGRRREAEEWRAGFEKAHAVTVRMVPPHEYSYPAEVVTRQQMWEGVARLMYEIIATGRAIVHPSPDYFTSFWTVSELLATFWLLPRGSTLPLITSAHVARQSGAIRRLDHLSARTVLGVPRLGDAQADRFARLINNSDPITTAPEVHRRPADGGRTVAGTVRQVGRHDPELAGSRFWEEMRVPCPVCAPRNRGAEEIDWDRHLDLAWDARRVDHYGYFTARREDLGTGGIRCPGCRTHLRLVNEQGVRTLWTPIPETEPDREQPVIQYDPIWQVLPDDRRGAEPLSRKKADPRCGFKGRGSPAEARWISACSPV